MRFLLLRPTHRKRARHFARQAFLANQHRGANLRPYLRASIEADPVFSSLIGSLLVSIAIELAIKLIERWIEQRFTAFIPPPAEYQETEPGYVKD